MEKNVFFWINKILYTDNNTYFYIEYSDTNLKLISSSNNEIDVLFSFSSQNSENALWTFFKFGQNTYKIHNKNKCFIKIINLNIYCQNITLEEATSLQFLKIYEKIIEPNCVKRKYLYGILRSLNQTNSYVFRFLGIPLYRKTECIEKNIPQEDAVKALITLIQKDFN